MSAPQNCTRCRGLGKITICEFGQRQKVEACPNCKASDVKEQAPPKQDNERPDVWPQVIKDMEERHADGVTKYGVGLKPFNGRKQLVDAYQEVLDQAVYIKAAMLEADELKGRAEKAEAKLKSLGELVASGGCDCVEPNCWACRVAKVLES